MLRGGRVIDPATGTDEIRDVAIRDGRIVSVDPPGGGAPGPDWEVHEVADRIVTPGLIDLHGHWYLGSAYGVDPAANLRGGVTTAVDAGTAGYVTWASFREQSIDPTPLRALAFLNVSALGILFPLAGEMEDRRYARPRETADLIRAERDRLVGVKVRLSACAGDVPAALAAALDASGRAGAPLMVDVGTDDDGMPGILDSMRPGDILTHCFTGGGRGILGPDGRVGPEAWAARRRGVRFDVGHGAGSFSFAVARAALADGFLPDSISTDLHVFSIRTPVVDLPTTMAKFLHLGLTLPQVIALTTTGPAASAGLATPSLVPGAPADLAVLEVVDRRTALTDATRKAESARQTLRAEWTVVCGKAIRSADVPLVVRPLLEADLELLRPPES